MLKPLPILFLAATLSIFTACQTTSGTARDGRFDKADADKDGKLSKAEVSDYFVSRIFEGRDTNHDQKLTWTEWKVDGVKVAKTRFSSYDTNQDGSVTFEEALVYGRKHGAFEEAFVEADTNKDGFVTPVEVQVYYGSKEGRPN